MIVFLTLVDSDAVCADSKPGEQEYVPRKRYDKLEREVEILKAQVRQLLQEKQNTNQVPSSTDAPQNERAVTQASGTGSSIMGEQTETNKTESHPQKSESDTKIAEGDREQEARESKVELDTFLRRQVVLFNRGELSLEFNLAYSQDPTANACFDTNLSISSTCQRSRVVAPKFITRTVDTGILARYGIIDDLELDVGIAYGYIEQEQNFIPFDVPTPVRRSASLGVGDLGWALRYTAWHESGTLPNITVNVNAKSRTGDAERNLGTGFWNVGGGISLLKTFDPVVFFGSVGYTAVLERQGINPGDQIPYSLGTGFSLNDRVSFLASLVGSAIQRTEVNGRGISGTSREIQTLQFSTTIQLTKRLFFEPFVAVGLSDQASDFVVGFSIPYRFEGRFPLPVLFD